jgi:hypothetical protein
MKTALLLRRAIAVSQRATSSSSLLPQVFSARSYNTSSSARAATPSAGPLDSANAAIKQAFDAPPPVSSLLESFQDNAQTTGRFGYDSLRKPDDFTDLSARTQRRAKAIV